MANTPEPPKDIRELRGTDSRRKKKNSKAAKKPISNSDYKSDKQIQREEARRRAEKLSAVRKVVIACVAAALAIALVITGAIAVYNAVLDSGMLMRSRNAMETENFKVTNAMMSYYIFAEYHDYVEKVGEENLASYGLDPDKSLKKQQYNKSGSDTWFDYFLSIVMDETENMLILLEGASKDGVTLTEEELSAVKTDAAALDPADYGRGVRSEDIEKAMEYTAIADKYAQWLEDSVTVSDEEIDAYISEHEDDFLECSYRYYVVKYDLDDDDDDTSSEETSSENTSSGDEDEDEKVGRDRYEAKALAKELSECTTEEEFLAKVEELFGADLTEDELEQLLGGTLKTGLKADGTELGDWAFDEDTAVGDTKTIESETNGTFTVYMLASEPAVNENRVAEIRRILLTEDSEDYDDPKTQAETVYKEWQDGDATAESFSELADRYSEDTDVDGGYYEAVYYGSFDENINDWIYDPARVKGDTVLLEDGDGWNILYFESLGEPQCDYEARNEIYTDKLDALYDALEDGCTVLFHYNYMNSIPA